MALPVLHWHNSHTSALTGNDRNGVWRNLIGSGSRTVQTPEEHADQVARLVADLRMTAARYPKDATLRRLVSDLRATSPQFTETEEERRGGAVPARMRS